MADCPRWTLSPQHSCDLGWGIADKRAVKTRPVHSFTEEFPLKLLGKETMVFILLYAEELISTCISVHRDRPMFNASEKDEPERCRTHCDFAVGHAVMM